MIPRKLAARQRSRLQPPLLLLATFVILLAVVAVWSGAFSKLELGRTVQSVGVGIPETDQEGVAGRPGGEEVAKVVPNTLGNLLSNDSAEDVTSSLDPDAGDEEKLADNEAVGERQDAASDIPKLKRPGQRLEEKHANDVEAVKGGGERGGVDEGQAMDPGGVAVGEGGSLPAAAASAGDEGKWTLLQQPWNKGWAGVEVLQEFQCQMENGTCRGRVWNEEEPGTVRTASATATEGEVAGGEELSDVTAAKGSRSSQTLAGVDVMDKPKTLSLEEKWVVLTHTSAPVPLHGIAEGLSQWEGWSKVVVLEKPPEPEEEAAMSVFTRINCTVLFPGASSVAEYKVAEKVDWSTYARKMVGFLYAIENGALLIYQSHDTPQPGQSLDWIRPLHAHGAVGVEEEEAELFNVFEYFGHPGVGPRGFPTAKEAAQLGAAKVREGRYKVNTKHSTFLPIQHGISDNSPDLSADSQWDVGVDQFRRCRLPLAVADWSFSPFNSYSTAHYQPAFHLLFLPSSVGVSVADIWGSYWAQRLLWDLGGFVGYIHTNSRHPPTPLLDQAFPDSQQLEEQVPGVLALLQQFHCDRLHAFDCALELGYQFSLFGFWSSSDTSLLSCWLEDLHHLGHVPPPLLMHSEGGRQLFPPDSIAVPRLLPARKLPCGTYSRHWTVTKEKMDEAELGSLCYPGNHLQPGYRSLPSQSLEPTPDISRPPFPTLAAEHPPRFVYLIHGDWPEMPPLLRKELCHEFSEVLMLTTDKEHEAANEAIVHSTESWQAQRNVLFSAALMMEQLRGWRWRYYVFIEADEHVSFSGSWKAFERFLVEVQPAMAAPLFSTSRACPAVHADVAIGGEANAMYRLDLVVNAFHHEAAVHLLPYSTEREGKLWWLAHALILHRCNLLYSRHIAEFSALRVCAPRDSSVKALPRDNLPDVEYVEAHLQAAMRQVAGSRGAAEKFLSCFQTLGGTLAHKGIPKPGVVLANRTVPYSAISYETAQRC